MRHYTRFTGLALALLIAVSAWGAQFEWDLGQRVDDTAAEAWVTLNGWVLTDGMHYRNSTDDTIRMREGGAWIESDANTAVGTSSHTQGTDLGLDTGGANPVTAITITGHNASTANPHATDIGNLGAGTMAELDTAISDGDVRPQWQTDLFVDQTSGSDVTPGPWGYATIGAALAVAASGDTVVVNPATYVENISIPVGVRLLGEWANLTGTIILEGDDSFVSLYLQTVATGTTGLTLAGVNQTGTAEIRAQLNAGTADGISVTDSASTLFYSGLLQTVTTGEGLSSGSAGSVYYDLPLIDASGAGTCVYASPTADVTGYIGSCTDSGAGVGLYVEALGYISLEMWRLDAANAYTVEAAGELRLHLNEIVGTQINAGTAVVVVDSDLLQSPLTMLELDTAISDGDVLPQRSGTIYVDGTNGSDATPAPWGYATLAAALAVAGAGDVIEMAPGAYTETVTVPADVTVWGPGVTLTGNGSPNVTLVDGSRIVLNVLTVPGAQVGVLQATAAATSQSDIRTVNVGAAGFGFINTAANAIHIASGDTCNAAAGAYCWGDIASSDGHIDLDYDNCYGTGAAGTCIATFGAGQVVGYLGHSIDRTGTLTTITAQGTAGVDLVMAEIETTTGIIVNATSTVRVVTSEVDCTTAYNVTAGGALTLITGSFSGTQTGTASLVVAETTAPVVDRDPDALKTGFENITDTTMGFVDGSMTFTLTDAGAGYNVAIGGVITAFSGNDTVVITDTQGRWYIYYDATFTLVASQTIWTIDGTVAPVATVYWDATANDSYDTLSEERHLWTMDVATHQTLHESVGARISDGLDLTYTPGAGAADADAQVAITGGVLYDEDIEITIVDAGVPAADYEQDLGLPAKIPIWYRLGPDANDRWASVAAGDYPIRYTTQGRYNWNNAGTWQQASVTDGNFFNAWICYGPRPTDPVFAIQGQTDHATLTAALTETLDDMTLAGLPVPEVVYAYRVTYETNAAGYANTPSSRIVEAAMIPGTAPGGRAPRGIDHNTLLNRDLASAHPADVIEVDASGFAGNLSATDVEVQTALDTLDAMSAGGGDTIRYELDLSGTYDWQANGSGSTDTTSGLTCTGDCASFTTLEVGGGQISIDGTTGASNLRAYLWVAMDDLPDLKWSSAVTIFIRYSIVSAAGSTGNARPLSICVAGDEDLGANGYNNAFTPDEHVCYDGHWNAGGSNYRIGANGSFSNTYFSSSEDVLGSPTNVHYAQIRATERDLSHFDYDETTKARLDGITNPNNWFGLATAGGKPYLVIQSYLLDGAPNEGAVSLTIDEIRVTMP
jgi:hypothetical protein